MSTIDNTMDSTTGMKRKVDEISASETKDAAEIAREAILKEYLESVQGEEEEPEVDHVEEEEEEVAEEEDDDEDDEEETEVVAEVGEVAVETASETPVTE